MIDSKGETEGERLCIHLFTPYVAAVAMAGPGQSRGVKFEPGLPHRVGRDPGMGAILCCFPRNVSRELGPKWSSPRTGIADAHVRCQPLELWLNPLCSRDSNVLT